MIHISEIKNILKTYLNFEWFCISLHFQYIIWKYGNVVTAYQVLVDVVGVTDQSSIFTQ